MSIYEQSFLIGEHQCQIETGKVAKQASGAIWVRCGDSVVLVTAQAAKSAREGAGFIPLTVDYVEKMSAAGKIPGGFFKREGKLRDSETLNSRIIDRTVRPLMPEGWFFETQVMATVFSLDRNHPTDTLAMLGASAALSISDIPFAGPVCGVRVIRLDGNFIANPSYEQLVQADINIFVSCSADAIMMVEGGAKEVGETEIIDALFFAHQSCQPAIEAQNALRKACGKDKRDPIEAQINSDLRTQVEGLAKDLLCQAIEENEKLARYKKLDEVKAHVKNTLLEQNEAADVSDVGTILGDMKYDYVRGRVVNEGWRIGGRGPKDIRNIESDVSFLPRTHGSCLFTRGETQAIVTATLGTKRDEQMLDEATGTSFSRFMLHYNFPSYSVGEVRPNRGPGRREIGHGTLAARALQNALNLDDDFPYVIRVLSDVTESNGSSSMATVCGGSMAMMDAGVPMKSPVAGIAMGLIKEGEKYAILSDILGDEDHLGDMDFKVAGTENGITAIQMDIKIKGVTREIMAEALEQARDGRLHILGEMAQTLKGARESVSEHAPQIETLKISTDKIRDLIGPGGKVIKDIIARTECQVDVTDDGLVTVAGTGLDSTKRALQMIKNITQEAVLGKLYLGNVRKCTDFGAFVEIFPGTDGLLHISELADQRVNRVEDVVQEGDEVLVKVIGMERGKIRLSRKAALEDERQKNA